MRRLRVDATLLALVLAFAVAAAPTVESQIGLGTPANLPTGTQVGGAYIYRAGGTDVAFADGGTGLSSAADDTALVSSGTAWQAKAIADCDDTSGAHLNYDTGTNAFSCGTSAQLSGVAAGYKVARGTITLDGTNPSSAATGLASIVSCSVDGPAAAAIPGDDPVDATPFINTTTLDIYAWKTDGTDPTPVASTNNTAVFYWVCVGT